MSKILHGQGMLIAVGGLCYYIGDNLTNLITEYGGELDCGPECIEGVQIFGIAMLGAATVTYLPVLTDVFSERVSEQTESGKKITQARIVVLLLLAKLTDVDLVYDAIERAASNKCNKVMIGAWVYYGVYLSVFLCFTVYRMWNVIKETKNTAAQEEKCGCMHTCTRILEVVMGFLVFVFAASYILADNRLPLACTIIDEINQDIVIQTKWIRTDQTLWLTTHRWYAPVDELRATHKRAHQLRISVDSRTMLSLIASSILKE